MRKRAGALPCDSATATRASDCASSCSLAPAALLRARLPAAGPFRAALLRGPFARDLGAGFARFAETDGDRLFAALHLRVTTLSALERACFALVHRALHALARGLAILARARFASGGHASLSAYG